jgi:hypothetical protein
VLDLERESEDRWDDEKQQQESGRSEAHGLGTVRFRRKQSLVISKRPMNRLALSNADFSFLKSDCGELCTLGLSTRDTNQTGFAG